MLNNFFIQNLKAVGVSSSMNALSWFCLRGWMLICNLQGARVQTTPLYIQEYFLVRANVVKAELCQLQQLFGSSDAAALPRGDGQLTPWQIFFSHI